MKKILCTIMIALSLLNYANADMDHEITFQKIPWLSNEDEIIKILEECDFLDGNRNMFLYSTDKCFYLAQDEEGFVWPTTDEKYKNVSLSVSFLGRVKAKIGGYTVRNVLMTFANDGESKKLIAVKIELFNSDYSDILSKLNKVYGNGIKTIDNEIVESTVWYGRNNSAILLFTESEGLTYQLIYGRLDALTILQSCLDTINIKPNSNDVSGL